MKYTTHIDPSLQAEKLPPSTIAVFPVSKLNYMPPHTCMGSGIAPGSQEKYQQEWNDRIALSIAKNFPKQKFVFLEEGKGLLSSSAVDFYGIVEQSKRASRAQQINAMKPDSTIYEPMITSNEMQTYLKAVADSTGARYAVVFASPSLSGDVQTTYNGGMNGGSFNQQTVYTADVQALVWECSTGKLLFSSGGWGAGSSSCFLFVPQNMAMDDANSKFEKNLLHLLTNLIDYDASKRCAAAF
jgi:hypothetical protein